MRPQFLMRAIARLMMWLSAPFVTYHFRGGACIDDHPNWVMAANHRSVFDFPLAVIGLRHFGWYSRIMIAAEFFYKPVYGQAVRAIDAIPVYRKTDPQGALNAAIIALKEGDSLCIMPEGTVHWDPEEPMAMGPVRTGVSRLAVAGQTPVMPIALVGTERVWPHKKGPKFRFRQPVVCMLADEPLWLTGDDHRANAEKVREVTEALVAKATAELQRIDPSYLPQVRGN